jgi:hypothetical protein
VAAKASFPRPRHHIEESLVARAAADPVFGELLRRDPKAALSQHLRVDLPERLKVEVIEERPDRMVIVIPVDLSAFRRPTIDAMVGRPPPPRTGADGDR